jgi:hypothetical protein
MFKSGKNNSLDKSDAQEASFPFRLPDQCGQLVRVFVAYADNHPERLHEDWEFVMLSALQQSFPAVRAPRVEG